MAAVGNLIRLLPLHINEIPHHPCFESYLRNDASNSRTVIRPHLRTFLEALLDQAGLITSEHVQASFKYIKEKASPPSFNKVRLFKRCIGQQDLQSVGWTDSIVPRDWSSRQKKSPEAWFARISEHANHVGEGTADYLEFDAGLRVQHQVHEQEYTPNLIDAYKILDWNEDIRKLVDGGSGLDDFTDMNMSIYEMCHKLPGMLSNRVFPVLVATAKRKGANAFIVVQVPVDVSNLKDAFYSNRRNLVEGNTLLKKTPPVIGVYVSVETCRVLPNQNTEWTMATASDAKGILPMWAQKMAIPDTIAKDVGFFIKWNRIVNRPSSEPRTSRGL